MCGSDFNCLEGKFLQESWRFCVAFCIESWLLTYILLLPQLLFHMAMHAVRGRWNTYGIKLSYLALLIVVLDIRGCCALNSEGLALLRFRVKVDSDPYGVLENWNSDHCDPCRWSGVRCMDGKVQMLYLHGYSLKGKLAPELGNLTHLKSLVLSENHLFGGIPKEFGRLRMLEVLDLRDNNLSGRIPAVLGDLQSLRSLLICDNKFEGKIPLEIGKLHLLTELQFDGYLTSDVATATSCINRKFGHCIWHGSLRPFKTIGSFIRPLKGILIWYFSFFTTLFPRILDAQADFCYDNLPSSPRSHIIHAVENKANIERRKLVEQSSNLAAVPANGGKPLGPVVPVPSSRSSGSFPAVPNTEGTPPPPLSMPSQNTSQHHQPQNPGGHSNGDVKQPTASQAPPSRKSGSTWKYIGIGIGAFLVAIFVCLIFICKSKAAKTIGPWKTGLSGQLQKAFITGVPKLNRPELETACEDFSNIVCNRDTFTIYKGTLSSGVEIAVVSTAINSLKDWSKRSELTFRKKIDSLSRINHKNFTNLIGYCEEDEPFTRMMVFEYATNGNLFEHLHEELEPLDWPVRMRAIMGTAYCLEYMHNLNPPLSHSDVNSHSILFTDDYAAKITELAFWSEIMVKSKSASGDLENSELPPLAEPETNVYSFGILLLEVISGKSPYLERESLLSWAEQCLNDRQNLSSLVDPTLKSFKNNELMVICEVMRECLREDPRKRPTIKEVIKKLREAIDISPDAAVPSLSPLWWAELEILSSEAV